MRKTYSVHLTDMYDKDVFINIRIFYARCGYRFVGFNKNNSDLIVILRGTRQNLMDYSGSIHVYDYVKNFREYGEFFNTNLPNRYLITLETGIDIRFGHEIRAYLPVFPKFWQNLVSVDSIRNQGITHIGSYKGLKDSVEQGMINFLKRKNVKVFGFNWSKVGIITSGLSHFKSNRMFSQSMITVGLMYPYQRGKTLSSRAWHGPIHGCYLLSHESEAVKSLNLPGLIYTKLWDETVLIDLSAFDAKKLRLLATEYWENHTDDLALKLGMSMMRRSRGLERWLVFYELKFKHLKGNFRSRFFAALRAFK